LDVNVAGYPGLNAPPLDRIGRKGGLAWADLTGASLPGWTSTPSDPADLINWRWPTVNYADYVDGVGARSGSMLMPAGVSGANRFLSRGDLLKYLRSGGGAQFANQGADFAPQATVFNRELNAPAFRPDSSPLQSPAAMNPFLPSVRVASAFIRRDGSAAVVGEPLVSSRFPLSQIALLEDPEDDPAAIQAFFGLTSNGDGTWTYSAGTVSTASGFTDGFGARERLKTLEEIAGENREPNFFETLQAGILADTLGLAAKDNRDYGSSGFAHAWADRNIARQILQIGANIIDQYDENNDPTVVRRPDTLKWSFTTPDPDIAGVENTPFLQLVAPTIFRNLTLPDGTGADGLPRFPTVTGYFQFQLWNPHRNALSAPAGDYRIVAQGSVKVLITAGNVSGFSDLESSPRTFVANGDDANPSQISFSTGSLKFAEPSLLRSDDVTSANSRDRYAGASPYGMANIAGFWAGDLSAPYDRVSPASPPDGNSHAEIYGGDTDSSTTYGHLGEPGDVVFFQLQKKDTAGNWIPVQTFPVTIDDGYMSYPFNETLKAQTDGGSSVFSTYDLVSSDGGNVVREGSGSHHFHGGWKQSGVPAPFVRRAAMLTDPRSLRFGSRMPSTGFNFLNTAAPMATTSQRFGGWLLAANRGAPVIANTGVPGTALIGTLYDNRSTADFSVRDRGGNAATTYRLGDPAVENLTAPADPYTASSSRPVLLSRPFKSVAEMAFAGRDFPWHSINFVHDLEAPASTDPVKLPADSALLDLFTISEMPAVRAGVINLNSASEPAIRALLLGSDFHLAADPAARLSAAEADSAATAIFAWLGSGKRVKAAADPILSTPADIARMVQALSAPGGTFNGWSKAKKQTLIAALAQAHNGRTWNLLIDVIVQAGRFSPGANALGRFSVQGERRLLVHLAIDRLTGKIVDQMTEQVTEE
jgi:hypothetical protein